MEKTTRNFREPKSPESWTKTLTIHGDEFSDCTTLPERAEGEYNRHRNFISITGPSEIVTFQGFSDIPDYSVEPANIQFFVSEKFKTMTVGDEKYHRYGNLVVLEKSFDRSDGKKVDMLSATVGILPKDYDDLRTRILAAAPKRLSLLTQLDVVGLGLDWTREGSLDIVGLNIIWKGKVALNFGNRS